MSGSKNSTPNFNLGLRWAWDHVLPLAIIITVMTDITAILMFILNIFIFINMIIVIINFALVIPTKQKTIYLIHVFNYWLLW